MHKSEVHCPFMPSSKDRIDIGIHMSGFGAMIDARKVFKDASPCKYCCHDVEDA